MKYQIYKFEFQTSVHFGDGGLTTGKNTLFADTIFSALCQEALKAGKMDTLLGAVSKNALRISDGLPYIGENYYIPKPLYAFSGDRDGDSKAKKALKQLSYIPVNKMDAFLNRKMDIDAERKYFSENFGQFSLVEKASVFETKDSEPYAVTTFRYGEDSGLYLIVGAEEEEIQFLIADLLESLSYSGIGGKRSSGYGRFVIKMGKMDPELEKRLQKTDYHSYALLSVSLPKEEELEKSIDGARYQLVQRSGFIDSCNYAESFRKKKDQFLFTAGSVFQNKFEGEILDVSEKGKHPVYRYAKALFMGVK